MHAVCVFVAGIHQSRTWISGSFESVWWNACVHRVDLSLYSHPKEFWRTRVSAHVNSKGKILSTGKIHSRGGSNPRHCIKQDSEPNTLPTSYSGPKFVSLNVAATWTEPEKKRNFCTENFLCWKQCQGRWRKQVYAMFQSVCLLVGCLTSQQQASVSQGRICSDNFTCCHTEIEAADQTFYLTQSQYTDTGPTSPSADPITPGAWQGSHWSANF